MRDFRDAKAMAHTLRAALAARGLKISNSQSLELIAEAFGAADWNTLSAAIKAAAAAPSQTAAIKAAAAAAWARPDALPTPERPAGRVGFSAELEATLHRAVALARQRQAGIATLEHLLLALVDDADAAAVMRGCEVDLEVLRSALAGHLDYAAQAPTIEAGQGPSPSPGFQRAIQRAVIHVQSSGREEVTGANVLVAIFSEQESHAAAALAAQGVSRVDVVNFIVHGLGRSGGAAA